MGDILKGVRSDGGTCMGGNIFRLDKIKIAWGVLKKVKSGRQFVYLVKVGCPFCNEVHSHGAGFDGKTLGYRVSHCNRGPYEIKLIEKEQ